MKKKKIKTIDWFPFVNLLSSFGGGVSSYQVAFMILVNIVTTLALVWLAVGFKAFIITSSIIAVIAVLGTITAIFNN